MNTQSAAMPEAESENSYPAYAFHDPAFVEWWLGSLHLMGPADQVAVAEVIYDSIHIPEVQARIAQFIQTQAAEAGIGAEPAEDEPMPEFEGTLPQRIGQMLRFHLLAYRKENPKMFYVFLAGMMFAVGKGVWVLVTEAQRLLT